MKKLFIPLVAFFLIGCSTTKQIVSYGVNKVKTETIFNKLMTDQQIDSILEAEHIASFDSTIVLDGITGKWTKEYYYLKDSLVYRIIGNKVTKRINK